MTTLPPFLIRRDGSVVHRASGTILGTVSLSRGGWIGRHVDGRLVQKGHWNGRKYAARALYEETPLYVPPPVYQHGE